MLVAVTGSLACGKSAVMRVFQRLGFETHYSDDMVHRLYEDVPEAKERIGKEFGKTVVNTGSVDSQLLAIIVFSDRKKLEKLNSIVHPLVREKIKKIAHAGKIVFVEVPLLFEAGFEKMFDRIILVRCSRETALRRAHERGLTEGEFGRRTSFQWPAERKEKRCDCVIDSDVSLREVSREAEEIAARLKEGSL